MISKQVRIFAINSYCSFTAQTREFLRRLDHNKKWNNGPVLSLSKRLSMEWRKSGEAPPKKSKGAAMNEKTMTIAFEDSRDLPDIH